MNKHIKLFRIMVAIALILSYLPISTFLLPVKTVQAACGTPANEIEAENCLPGNPPSEWDVAGAGDENIQGYATDISVDQGGTIGFKVDTDATDYRLDIYRLGYYGGNGARFIATVQPSVSLPQNQPACLFDSTDDVNLVDCGNWAESASWTVPTDAVSGIYIAKLEREDGTSGASHITFVVRDDDGGSDLLFQTSDTTWQAYNGYGGYSLYAGPLHAHKVSYNRPFATRTTPTEDFLFNSEYPMLLFLEQNGYDVSYSTDLDTDRNGAELLEHKVFLSVGHDEYWSAGQRAAVEAARDAGVHLAFFSGNEIYWKTRWENSTDGSNTPYRTLVSYKEGSLAPGEHYDCFGNDACDPDPVQWTGLWRDGCNAVELDGCRPENALSGTISWDGLTSDLSIPAEYGDLRFWRNTTVAGLSPGTFETQTTGTLGYEWDFEQALYADSYPSGRILLSSTDFDDRTHHLSLYRASSGALVFSAGTVQWAWGLDDTHDRAADPVSPSMQQATVNLLADMGVQPTTLQAGLTPASVSTDITGPTAAITSPASGTDVPSGSVVTITGTAADTGGGVVAAVEVSVDGGTTWKAATGRDTWSYEWVAGSAGSSVTILSRAVDDSLNIGSESAGIIINVTERVCPCSIWNDTIIPANPYGNDGQGIEVGVKFQSIDAGNITGIQFYKGSANTGTHTGHLWAADGTQLAEAVFTNETASGWQEIYFDTPVAIQANTTYVASYHSSSGGYAYDQFYFSTSDYANAPLRALANTEDTNGVWSYASSPGTFPINDFNATNYWVDVVFNYSGPDTTPPQITAVTPTADATGVDVSSTVTAHFNEAVKNVNTGTFTLTGPGGAVAAAVTYDSGTHTAILTPSAALSYNTTYTAEVIGNAGASGIQDLADNDLPATVSWSFTTALPDTTPPEVVQVSPTADATGVSVTTQVTAQFDEAVKNVSTSTFTLTGPGGAVAAAVMYNAGSLTAILTPSAALSYDTTYTAEVIGGAGASGIQDLAGNDLPATVSWSFTTGVEPISPEQGPGGPILVVADPDTFGRYYNEILRNEGLNEFEDIALAALTTTDLTGYDVVILAEQSRALTAGEVSQLTTWVTNGGNLIAMRPGAELAGLLGLSVSGGSLSDAYLLIETGSGPGVGLVDQTIQYHSDADLYSLNGATEIARLYSNASTATSNPAITINTVGSGQAAAFTYDLARSIIYTRQGNPAWDGDERDGIAPIRSDDLFYGAKVGDVQPDYIDHNKVAIPQADEQQRLLANLIQSMNQDQKPLPRFWYFPRGEKAVVVMTADHHSDGTAVIDRFDKEVASSPAGCAVDDWECIRSTAYIYPPVLSSTDAETYESLGFEIALHVTTGCLDWTPASLQSDMFYQLGVFSSNYPTIQAPTTNRTHCIVWSDYATQPQVEFNNGIRLDTNYYYWPPDWVGDSPGVFTGSGMPMRFRSKAGGLIDVYQATTQLTDESSQTYPNMIDTLLDRAIGPEGYYGAFTANIHTDLGTSEVAADAIVASALARSVPVVTASQMLTWLDGRNSSSFANLSFAANVLSFDILVGAGAHGLQAMVPSQAMGDGREGHHDRGQSGGLQFTDHQGDRICGL